jgi:polysaccharide biosynthesis/export protein
MRTKLTRFIVPIMFCIGFISFSPVVHAQIIVKDTSRTTGSGFGEFPDDNEMGKSTSIKNRIMQLKRAGVSDDEIVDFFSKRKVEPGFDVRLFLKSKGRYKSQQEEEDDIMATDLEAELDFEEDEITPFGVKKRKKTRAEIEKDPLLKGKSDSLDLMKKKKILLEQKKKKEKEDFLARKDTILDNIFGQKLFSQKAINFSPDENIIPPDDYLLGPGDEIVVTIWGTAEFYNSYLVDKDGSIYPEGVGRINLLGVKLKTAREMIKQRFASIVSAGANVEVVMGKARTIRINVVGEVVQPGTYTISALHSAFNALYLAGGPNDIGSLRSIYIKREGKTIDTLDVYAYLIKGDMNHQIFLHNNDFIIVPSQKKVVNMAGEVKRPIKYELKPYEHMKDLLLYSGGPKPEASTQNVQIRRYFGNEVNVVNLDLVDMLAKGTDFILEDGDSITFSKLLDTAYNTVQALGEFKYPGVYQIKKGDRIWDLLDKSGGLTKEAYTKRAYIQRINDKLEIDYIPVDLQSILRMGAASSSNIELAHFDALKVYYIEDFKDIKYISIRGEIRKPGSYIYSGKRTLKDLIYQAGGPTDQADFNQMEVSRVISDEGSMRSTKTQVINLRLKLDWENDASLDSFDLKPFDQVFIRKNPNFELQENVKVQGEVFYPGEYSKLEKSERLSSIVNRAGGLTKDAYLEGTKIIRDKQEVVIDLKKALDKPGSTYDNILKDGDIVMVPEVNDVVRVEGGVLYPVNISFDPSRTNFSTYLNSAGGFGERAMKRKSIVRYANGKIKRTKSFLFIKFYPKVDKGATVQVPVRPLQANQGVNIQAIVGITTGLVTMLVLISQLSTR